VSSSFCLAKIWFGSSFPVQVFVYLSGFWWPEKLEIGFFFGFVLPHTASAPITAGTRTSGVQ